MSASFTPGPWNAVEYDDRHEEDVIPVKAGRHTVCEVEGWATDAHPAMTVAEAESNARLIAAAPDYHTACGGALHPGEADTCGPLAWLRSAIDTLREDAVRQAAEGDDTDAYWMMVGECEVLHRNLVAALAKARGEQ